MKGFWWRLPEAGRQGDELGCPLSSKQNNMSSAPRIVSLLPSASEIICLAGAESMLVGRSHECDWPASITHLPILTAASIPAFTTSMAVHLNVTTAMEQGTGLYSIDGPALLALQPTLIVTQSVCSVCSIDLVVVEKLVASWSPETRPTIINLNPQSLQDVIDDVLRVGEAAGTLPQAQAAVKAMQERLEGIKKTATDLGPAKLVKCCFLEWTDPLFNGGHWTPALVEMAGGTHPLNPPKPGEEAAGPSVVITPEAVQELDPDVIIICPCGLDLAMGRVEAGVLARNKWWQELRAVKKGNVFLVDGNAHFNRPGPRLLDAAEFLVAILHERWELIPASFAWELLALLPDQAIASAGNEDDVVVVGSQPQVAGDEERASTSRPSRPSLSEESPAADCDGSHCAPHLAPDVEDAYEAALVAEARSYKDPVSGYQCFTELALRARPTCCGNRCRHCPYGHFKVNTLRKGQRLNRITAPVFMSWGNSGLPPPTHVTLLAVGSGQHLAAITKLEQLRAAGLDVVVLVAVDPTSRAMWGSSGSSGAGAEGGDVDTLSQIMDVCLKEKTCMVAVPLSEARGRLTRGEAAGLAAWVVGQARTVLDSMLQGVEWVEQDAVPDVPWLVIKESATWSSVVQELKLGDA